jgi:hypothetical protein
VLLILSFFFRLLSCRRLVCVSFPWSFAVSPLARVYLAYIAILISPLRREKKGRTHRRDISHPSSQSSTGFDALSTAGAANSADTSGTTSDNTEHPHVFDVTQCSVDGMDLPGVDFKCDHSYHQRYVSW